MKNAGPSENEEIKLAAIKVVVIIPTITQDVIVIPRSAELSFSLAQEVFVYK